MRLALFTTDPELISRVSRARIESLVVDLEHVGKDGRQAGADTEINRDTVEDLEAVAAATDKTVICRINRWDPGRTPDEVEAAISAGADTLLLPMVRRPREVEGFLRSVDGRVEAGILVETVDAVASAAALARLAVSPVYVGLNDLAIERGSSNIFLPLLDGTIDRLAELFGDREFGFGGLTVVDGGWPIPCRLLLADMVRVGASFTFLRRSFKRDIPGKDPVTEVERLHEARARAARRTATEVEEDRRELARYVRCDAAETLLSRSGSGPEAAAPGEGTVASASDLS